MLSAACWSIAQNAAVEVTAPPEEIRQNLRLDPFYVKYASAEGFPVVSSAKVSDEALREAVYIVNSMLANRPDVREQLIKEKIRLAVMAPTEMTTDIPEHSDLKPKEYWDRRARGLGATRRRPAVSCGEENLLHLDGDRYPRENILVHEFAHAIHEMGLARLDRGFNDRLQAIYDRAMKAGLWKGTYAATNRGEYWAEGVQSYFDTNDRNNPSHGEIDTREKLATYDPELFALIDEAFKQSAWRYKRRDQRQ